MKKHIIIISAVLLGVFCFTNANAQETTKAFIYPASMEYNKAQSLWFNSSNAAGLVATPLQDYNDVSANYKYNNGDFKKQQDGDKITGLSFNTNGALRLGKVSLRGDCNFANQFDNGSTYNTMMFQVPDDMPYYVSDPQLSNWKRQLYDMSLKAATPLFWDCVGLGITANYTTRTGAKQKDPRSTTYYYHINVKPAIIVNLGAHYFGLSGVYENMFERTIPTNSDSQNDQSVFIMKGLGNFSEGTVGGLGGVGTFYYKGNTVGGAFQYGKTGDLSLLLDLNYQFQVIDVYQSPTKPQRMGSTKKTVYGGNLQAMLNGEISHKVTLDYYHRSTDGIEYVQELDNTYEVQQWITITKFIRSNYAFQAFNFNYDLFLGQEKGYSWRAGVNGTYSNRQDEYYLPDSNLDTKNFYGEIFVKKNFSVGYDSAILLGINGGYNKNLSGEYNFNGSDPTSVVVTDFFAKDFDFLTSNYWKLGANVNFTFPLGIRSTALYIGAEANMLFSQSNIQNAGSIAEGECPALSVLTKAVDSNVSSYVGGNKTRLFAKFTVGFTF